MTKKIRTGCVQYVFMKGRANFKTRIDQIKARISYAQVVLEDKESVNVVQAFSQMHM